MTRIIFPLLLKDIIEDDQNYKPPYVKLIPRQLKFDKESTGINVSFPIETGETKTAELPQYKKPRDIKGVEVGDNKITEIILPMPSNVVDALATNYVGVEGLGILQSGGVGEYLKWKGVKMLASMANMLPQEIAFAIKTKALGSGIDNPQEKLMASGHDRRTFTLEYTNCKPTSEEEEKHLAMILNVLKYSSICTYGRHVIFGPPSFDVEFHSTPSTIILSYDNCKISSYNETLGGSGESFSRMESGFPISSFSVTFNEMDYVTKEKIISKNKKIRF